MIAPDTFRGAVTAVYVDPLCPGVFIGVSVRVTVRIRLTKDQSWYKGPLDRNPFASMVVWSRAPQPLTAQSSYFIFESHKFNWEPFAHSAKGVNSYDVNNVRDPQILDIYGVGHRRVWMYLDEMTTLIL